MIDGISALTASGSSVASLGATSSLASLGATGSAGATGAAAPGADPGAGVSFGQVMSQVSGDAIGALKSAEAASIEGLQGAAPVHKVVEAIMSAQRSLQSALALRDKAVTAYQEISRMAI
ncbi:MAG: flagellar hook-basal body complex protein FliE [Roseiarcus sp.]